MSTMAELAEEYRAETARLAMRLAEKRAAGASEREVRMLEEMLREMRAKQRVLSSYYDAPRDPSITMTGLFAPRRGNGA